MQKHGKKSLSGDILRDFGDIIKWNNIHIMGIPEGKQRKKRPEKIFEEKIAENCPNTGKK